MDAREPEFLTVGRLIDRCEEVLTAAALHYGHGTDNARDEAAALVVAACGLRHDDPALYRRHVDAGSRRRIEEFLRRRIDERLPLPYVTGEAWFAGLPFHVDRRVLIPRSPFAELIRQRFQPWLGRVEPRRILEIGTGSACIAIACALAFPGARVVATDISPAALAVAARNVARHRVGDRVQLLATDVDAGLRGEFDLLLSNPPYVPEAELDRLPPEYRCEPRLGLASGPDGMALPRRVVAAAARLLAPTGWLAIEVGAWGADLQAAFPGLPFIWPELVQGGEGIALLPAAELAAQECVE
ncbi:MAG: 50S ribosomal protein L3 N(5)-glutamine methyltransferase [Gammaproteobacteria bacterium]|nr:MAG: 50S ribosomal protein L3 N(5)-glutamine methyltransferase [Gammaproteobacteria bacterium]